MGSGDSHDQDRLTLQDELVDLQQRLELSRRRVIELEESNKRLHGDLEREHAERAKLEEQVNELQELLSRNPTTGLPIRRLFESDFTRVLSDLAVQTRGPHAAVGLLRLDGEYAKIKNTRDRTRVLLFKTADRIREIVGDNIYQSDRLDEFLIILRDMPNADGVELRADQIVEAVKQPHEPPADDVRFGCHLGIAVHPDHGTTREELLGNADIALVESERSREPFIVYSEAMGVQYRERQQLEAELRNALQAGFEGLYLSFQPFTDIDSRVCGSEALIRWDHDRLGAIPPDRFVPVAEEMGAIRFIGQWTLYRACRQLKRWHAAGHEDLYVSVNLSPSQFRQVDLVDRIGGILESLDLDGRFLTLELTETTVMDEPEEAIAKMRELRSMGTKLALDDFGTGYSSLSYLRRFQFDTLKIDRSFITDVHLSRNDQEIVKAMIAMSRAFGMKTLAEGVEHRDELDFLFEHGCDLVQGFYFSPPVVHEDFTSLLERGFAEKGLGSDYGSPYDSPYGSGGGSAAAARWR